MKIKPIHYLWIALSAIGLVSSGIGLFFLIPYLWNQPIREVDSIQASLPAKERLSVKDKAELIDRKRGLLISAIGTGATIVGGVVLLVGVYQAKQKLDLDAAQLALSTAKADDDNRQVESRLISERFSKAIEQLGSNNTHVRLGGIYSLEKIAKDSLNDHWTVMEVLTAFIREESPKTWSMGEEVDKYGQEFEPGDHERTLQITIQAAATAIAYRDVLNKNSELNSREKIDLSGTNLGGVQWAKANLVNVNLFGGSLIGANLRGADLRNAYLRNADLRGADLNGADLRGADLRYADFMDADLQKANLRGAYLSGAKLRKASLIYSDLREADLLNANLCQAYLIGAKLIGAKLTDANLKSADLTGTKLTDANLIGANLTGADLTGADLTGADLTGTNLTGADLTGAVTKDAKLPPLR